MDDKDMSKPLIDKVEKGAASDADAPQSDHDHHEHHDHHDHQDGYHGHHRRRRKRKKFDINSKAGWGILVGVCVLFVALIVYLQAWKSEVSNRPTPDVTSDKLTVEVVNPEGLLVKSSVQKYLLMDILNPENADKLPSFFADDEGRPDAQVPVSLKVYVREGTAILYKIELADNDLFMNARVSYIEDSSGKYDFEYLCTNTTYYYRVTVYMKEGTEVTAGRFKTADTPRVLSVDGLSNVRDIGNWNTDSGKRIKQGLLIRGTEMDGAVESEYLLTGEGMTDMLEVLGIKTDMDLRSKTYASKDALGALVEHKYYDMVQYDGIFTDAGKERVRAVFADLAEPDNYPIYLHCTYGLDRTGTVCYLLEALLGVSRGDCLRDYGLSNRMPIASIQIIEEGLGAYDGETLREQAEAYLLSCGVSEYQIKSIRNIFLGE